ncbi:MAG: histidinol dehydrogenase [Verrucomicrobiales bacterium]|nr:histidinol dehydrogenase [Verrucomicrobiales bacterium]
MNLIRHTDAQFEAKLAKLAEASSLFDPVIEQRTLDIIRGVEQGGDRAVLKYTKQFDGASLSTAGLPVPTQRLAEAWKKTQPGTKRAIRLAKANVASFAKQSLRKNWKARNAQGGSVGEKFDPFQRVGVYIPGGTAPLASTTLMTVTLAKAAGCPEIVACTPCDKNGEVNPDLLAALGQAGATEVYRVGGAQAIAAMACGTKTIRPVQKIFGPGNAYVVAAKRLLFGRVSIDLLPGPSELLVLADSTANPAFAAADLLAQAEHGSGHERVWLATPSKKLIADVQREIERQLPSLSRSALIKKALKNNGWLIHVKSIADGIALANRLAPEHCELMLKSPREAVKRITTAGALFIGKWTPTVLGDYMAGPSHTLPTGGAGASFPGLTVDMFQRRTSVVEYSKPALSRSIETVSTFAGLEGLDAHGRSAEIRLDK